MSNIYDDEVASVYAEIFYRLGYLTLDRTLSESEFEQLKQDARRFRRGTWRRQEMTSRYGPPSFVVGGGEGACHCYATRDRQKDWIFFDYEFHVAAYCDNLPSADPTDLKPVVIEGVRQREHPDYLNPPMRNARLPADRFREGFILTPYGRRMRRNFRRELKARYPD